MAIKRHGESGKNATVEYNAWASMKKRCFSPSSLNYPNYGGRGIMVCPEWMESYAAFLSDVGRRPSTKHSIERIDNNGHYEPSNVKWATKLDQGTNRRTTRFITFNNETHSLSEWCRITGIGWTRMDWRLGKGGWPVERALTTPVKKHREKKR